jgi:hypothetical protein
MLSHVQPATLEISHPAYDQLKKNGGILSEVTVNGDKFVPEAILFAAMNEVDRLRGIVKWIHDNSPRTLELCPYKIPDDELRLL